MTFAILQQSLSPPPTAEQLGAAFTALRGLTRQDGVAKAKGAYGFLAGGLTSWDAAALQKALRAQGVETLVADESTVPVLPPPKTLTRADPLKESLVIYDALGRSQTVNWSEVLLIAAGEVSRTTYRREVTGRMGEEEAFAELFGTEPLFTNLEVRHVKEQSLDLSAEIFATGERRFRVSAKKLTYSYLGSLVGRRATDNFLILLRDLMRLAAGAARNRGAELLAADPPRLMKYPSRHAFEEESTWCLWMKGRGT